MRFWDSSALVPLVVEQSSSRRVEEWVDEDASMVIWALAEIEIVSALRRLVREGTLAERQARSAEELAETLVARMHTVTDLEQTKTIAKRVLRLHVLRAADALQLAAALCWCEGRPTGRIFHTFDRRLADAAQREGFKVIPDAFP